MAFRARLVAAWYAGKPTPLAVALLPLSWLFAAVVALRRALYRHGWLKRESAGVPVVVTGNITAGGSGKTPLAMALATALAASGRKPGLVSRGYGGNARVAREVREGDDPGIVGDEPPLLAGAGFPVWIGRDRVVAARALRQAHPECDVIIGDDGLQHYRLARDVEIAVIDDARGLGNGWMLPAGPLREPASRLRDVDAIVHLVPTGEVPVKGADARHSFMTHAPVRFRNLVDPASAVDPRTWGKGEVHAIAGIGHPQRFFDLLEAMGIELTGHAFPDHHVFVADDLALPQARVIVMTAKDAVKCARFADARCHALDIRAVIDPALVSLVLERIDGR